MGNIINPYIFSPTVPRENLLAEYLFNDNSLDTSGNGYNGTNFGTFSYNTVLGKKCVSFTGLANSYIQSNLNKTILGTNFSISVWVLANNANDSTAKYIYSLATSYGSLPWVAFQQNISYMQYYYNAATYGIPNKLTANVWNHYVLTFNGTVWTSYFNNIVTRSITAPIGTYQGSYLFIGSFFSRTFNGCVAKFRAYNRVLTAEEITQLYKEI